MWSNRRPILRKITVEHSVGAAVASAVTEEFELPTRRRPRPTGLERPFEAHELFWSTTDGKGIITSGNDVFARVADYDLADMIGRPHNLIRHPDMPRGAFRLLWDYLESDQPIAAYVQNLAADGGHYWVLAYVAPTDDGGFLSIRLKPGTAYFDAARGIYERVRAFEREHERDLARRKDLVAAARDMVVELVRDAGFDSYDAFMQAALAAEVRQRADVLAADAVEERRPGDVRSELDAVAVQLSSWAGATESLHEQARTMVRVADDIELFSLNAQIASTRLGEDGRALLAVAGLLTRQATDLRPLIERQVQQIDDAARMLDGAGAISFATAVASLQLDLLRAELGSSGLDSSSRDLLAGAFERGVHQLAGVFEELQGLLARIDADAEQVRRGMDRLRALEVNGRIESTRVDRAVDLGRMFTDIGDHVRAATDALGRTRVGSIVQADAIHRVEDAAHALTGSAAA